mgnify:CR=1 FL=1
MLARIGTALAAALLCLGALACGDSADTAASSSSGGAGGATSSSATSGSATSASTGTGSGGDAEWTLVPWATPGCVVEYAKKPELAFPKLEWEPCPGGEPGCERIKKNWPQLSETAIGRPGIRKDGNGYELSLYLGFPEYVEHRFVVGTDGVATAAYRYPPDNDCLGAVNSISTDGHWVGVQRIGVNEPSRFVFQPRGAPVEQAEVVPTTQLAQYQRGGEELLALELDFGTSWLMYDRVTKQLHQAPVPFTAGAPRFAGGSAFMVHFPQLDKPEAWVFSRERGFAQLINRSPNVIVDVVADGQDLVWVESPPPPMVGQWQPGTLKRSPFTTKALDVVDTVVRPMPAIAAAGRGALGNGYYAVMDNSPLYHVVRLSDGRMWTASIAITGDGTMLEDISHVDDTYVFYKTTYHIYRQRLDQLGPGQPAN